MAKAKVKGKATWPQPIEAYTELEAKHPALIKEVRKLATAKHPKRK